jgi:pycsar effector protein
MADPEAPSEETYSPNAAHLVRTVQLAHVQLSAMADQKASILMGATFVIFTITIGQARTAAHPLPLLILGAGAFFSAVFAVLAILPATHYRKLGSGNLLFFGSFTQLSEEDFTARLMERLRSDDRIYRTMLHDIYQNGVVLERKKYRLLGYAYRIFLAGLTASFAAFVVEYFM